MKQEKTRVKCLKCNQIIEGDLRGTFISCNCGKTAVDQTEYCTRIIGNEKDYKILTASTTRQRNSQGK